MHSLHGNWGCETIAHMLRSTSNLTNNVRHLRGGPCYQHFNRSNQTSNFSTAQTKRQQCAKCAAVPLSAMRDRHPTISKRTVLKSCLTRARRVPHLGEPHPHTQPCRVRPLGEAAKFGYWGAYGNAMNQHNKTSRPCLRAPPEMYAGRDTPATQSIPGSPYEACQTVCYLQVPLGDERDGGEGKVRCGQTCFGHCREASPPPAEGPRPAAQQLSLLPLSSRALWMLRNGGCDARSKVPCPALTKHQRGSPLPCGATARNAWKAQGVSGRSVRSG